MKRITFLFIISIISVLLICTLVFAAEPLAVALKAKGKVSVFKGSISRSNPLKRGYRLADGDKIVTAAKSMAALRFKDDGSLVRIRANSTCTIQGKKEKNQILKNVYLEVGTIFARITKQKGRFQVTTPTSVASVKGTKLIVDQKSNPGTFYYGEEGLVEITNKAGTALLRAGETAYVANENTAPVVRKTREGEKPEFDEGEASEDEFEFEFENDAGKKKLLKFKATKKE
ncbi:FecR domain-containing protein [Calditrichota bacterium]